MLPGGAHRAGDVPDLSVLHWVRSRKRVDTLLFMPHLRISEAAELLGVSDDTVRRWVDAGRLTTQRDASGVAVLDGAAVAALTLEMGSAPEPGTSTRPSARNRMRGIVTRVTRDAVMAQVDIQAGPFRLVSLLSSEAVDELGIKVGSPATAVVKATNLGLEVPV